MRPLSARIFFKFMMPIVGALLAALLCYGGPRTFSVVILAVISLALMSIYSSAAQLQIQNRRIRYRRFFHWKDLPQDVSGARCLPLPALGCIRFTHYLPPFGLLFYIVEREEGPFWPFGRTNLMQAIVSSRGGEVDAPPARPPGLLEALQGDDRVRLRWILIAVASMLVGAFMPEPSQAVPRWTGVLKGLWDAIQLLNQPAALVVYAALLAWFLIRKRFQGIASAVGAFLLGSLVAHLLRLL